MVRLGFVWVGTAVLSLWLAACSGGRDERVDCTNVSECREGDVCKDGFCVDIDSASVSASVDFTGVPEAPVFVIDGAGNICELRTTCERLPYGSPVTFRAGTVMGYRFTGWSGAPACMGVDADLLIPSLTSDLRCTANYVRRVKVMGHASGAEGGVTAESDAPFANCGAGVCEVDVGQPVRLTASERFGQRFSSWSGEGCGSATTITTTVSTLGPDLVCTANYVQRILVSGTAMNADATIAVSSEGAVCEPGSCVIDKGGSATLLAPEVTGFRFAGWSGTTSCSGADPMLRLNAIQESQSCVATYAPRVTVAGSAAGAEPPPAITALSSDLYATCTGPSCVIDVGGTATLLASSAMGYRLVGWTGPQCEAEKGAAVMLTQVTSDVACVAQYLQGIAVFGAVVGAPGDVLASSTTEAAVCADGGCVIDLGGNVTLTAPQPGGYRFLGWDGDEGCASSELTISFPAVTQSKTCYARYASRFLARGNPVPAEAGSVTASSVSPGATCAGDGCTLDAGGEVVLVAAPNDGYRFSGWSGGGACTGAEPSLRLPNVTGNMTCQANFVGRLLATASSAPAEGGSVMASSDSGAANCTGATCQLDRGSRVSFTASEATGWRFTGWSMCSDATTPTVSFTDLQGPIACQANFTPLRYTVSSSVAPAEAGTVVASAQGGNAQCAGGNCTVDYGTDVALNATPATGWRFNGWSGCANATEPALALRSVRADATCQATFARIMFAVTASATPENGGTVTLTADGPGASCTGLRCSVPYGGGAMLSARAANGWTFGGWTGCSASMESALTLTNISADAGCQATFTRRRVTVTGDPQPEQGGTVVASSAAQGASCEGNRCVVNYGSNVALRATANPGFRFTGWSGCGTSEAAELTLENVTANRTCSASFERLRFMVTGTPTPEAGGSVAASSSAQGATCMGNRCTVNHGSAVTLTATPARGYVFSGWTGCPLNTGASITLPSVTDNVACTASFERPTFTVTASAGMGGSVAVTDMAAATCQGTSCTVQFGGSVTFVAAPTVAGFDFMGWTGGCTVDTAMPTRARAANVTGPVECTATFVLRAYRVNSVVSNGGGSISNAAAMGGTCEGAVCMVTHGGSATFTAAIDTTSHEFAGWSPNCTASSTNPLVATIAMVTGPATCTANTRALPRYTVTGTAVGGRITGATPAANCNTDGVCSVIANTTVAFTAEPFANYTFMNWTGCTQDPANPLRATVERVTADATCTATFVPRAYQVDGVVSNGGGTVAGSVMGAACPNAVCLVSHGGSATFTAAIDTATHEFAGWSPNCTASSTNPLVATISMVTGPATCTANTRALPRYTVTGRADGGRITGATPAASCNTDRVCTVIANTPVAFTAEPLDANYTFRNWTGCTQDPANPLRATIERVTADATCTANFVPRTFRISASSSGPGTVSVSYNNMPCADAICPTLPPGTGTTMTATPAVNATLNGWACDNGYTSTELAIRVPADANIHCVATFTAVPVLTYRVTTAANANRGSATISAATPIECNAARTSCSVPADTTVVLTATPTNPDVYSFLSWRCRTAAVAQSAVTSLAPTADTSCDADFAPINVTVSATGVGRAQVSLAAPVDVSGAAAGTCDGNVCTIPRHGSVTVHVDVPNGYEVRNLGGAQGTSCPSRRTVVPTAPNPNGLWRYSFLVEMVLEDARCQATPVELPPPPLEEAPLL